jgi:hypothetical protein
MVRSRGRVSPVRDRAAIDTNSNVTYSLFR